jgi:hypothetical protein
MVLCKYVNMLLVPRPSGTRRKGVGLKFIVSSCLQISIEGQLEGLLPGYKASPNFQPNINIIEIVLHDKIFLLPSILK